MIRRSTTLLLFAVLFVSGVYAQKTAKISFWETTHNFGSFSEKLGSVSCVFSFVNTGDAPLIITRATASCGCTRPEFPMQPVAPGDSGQIKVTYNAVGRPGSFEKNISVYANTDPERTTLIIKGSVIPVQRSVAPAYGHTMGTLGLKAVHVPFFEVYTKKTKVEKIDIINNGKTPLTLEFDKVPRHLDVSVLPETLSPGEKGRILITYHADRAKDWGIRRDEFWVKLPSSDKPQPQNKITVSADIQEDYSGMTPDQIAKAPHLEIGNDLVDFGTIKGNTAVSKSVSLTNTGVSNLQIRKVNNESQVVSVSLPQMSIQSGKSIDMKITVRPSKSRSRLLNHRIFIITNDPARPTISLPVVATFE